MSHTDLIERLAQHKTLGAAPREELAWLASHGTLRQLDEGEVLTTKGSVVEALYVILTGHIAIFMDRGAGRHKVMEWRAGDVTGMLPYSRMVSPPGDTVAQESCEVLALHRDLLTAMIRECHQATSIFVHKMIDRARHFTSSDLHDEKMVSLGKLSAGLAHELNNPAAAIERSAVLLESRLEEAERATRVLGASRLTDAQFEAIDLVRASCGMSAERACGRRSSGPSARRRLPTGSTTTASTPAVAGAGRYRRDDRGARPARRGGGRPRPRRGPPLGRRGLLGARARLGDSGRRDAIAGLVQAIKGFTHMDQATVAEPVDLAFSLGNTVTVLKSKARRSRSP